MKKILNIILLIILTISNNTIIFANAANATTTENPPISVSAIEDTPVTSTADIENPNSTEKGQGTVSEYATDSSKEFYTITANTGNGEKETFYMVIDKNSSSENVYFLKEVEVSDISSLSKGSNNENEPNEEDLNFVFGNEEALENKETEKSEVQIDEVKNAAPEETDENNSSETKKTKSTSPIIIIVVCIVVGAFGYYKKIYKKKNNKADENNDIADTYDYNTDDTNNINDTIDEKEESTEELFKKYENIKNDDIDVSESDIYEENNNGDNEDNDDEQPQNQNHYVDEEEFI